MNTEDKNNNKLIIYIVVAFVILTCIFYIANVFININIINEKSYLYEFADDTGYLIIFIRFFYSMIAGLAAISCISCYNSSKKDVFYFTFLLFLIYFVDILFGNIDDFLFNENEILLNLSVFMPNSIIRLIILSFMLFDLEKFRKLILQNKIKIAISVFYVTTFLGIFRDTSLWNNFYLHGESIKYYNLCIMIVYFAVCIKFFLKCKKNKEYIYMVLSASMLFFGLKWGFMTYDYINNSLYIQLMAISLSFISFVTFIGGVICELLFTINKNKKLEKDLKIFKQISDKSKHNCILMFNDNKKLIYSNEMANLYFTSKLDISNEELEKIIEEKLNNKIDTIKIKNISEILLKENYWSGSLNSSDITLNSSFQRLEFNKEYVTVFIFRDVTQREKEAKYLEEYKIYKKEKEFRNEFFANISHELRTPLNIFFSTTQLLDKYLENDRENFIKHYDFHKQSLKTNSYRMLRLINNILDIGKIDNGFSNPKFRNIDIISVVEDITLSIIDYAKLKNIDLIFDTQVEEHILKCDPEMIERIILNLLSNSIKFNNENGKISVDVFVNKEFVQIRIKDNGIGIPIKVQENIFDRFVQSDKSLNRNNEGSGIGLSIVYSMIKAHNGEIFLESEENEGTEFEIFLPNVILEEDNYTIARYNIDKQKIELELSDIYELYRNHNM